MINLTGRNNMGMFSWNTSDTKESIPASTSGKPSLHVKMLDDKGNEWIEKDYEGYGIFGGKDFYELLAEMNGLTTREEGINLAFNGEPYKSPKLITLGCDLEYEQLPNPTSCEYQGYFYPDGDDDDEDDWGELEDDI
jgi:hypothetical protein